MRAGLPKRRTTLRPKCGRWRRGCEGAVSTSPCGNLWLQASSPCGRRGQYVAVITKCPSSGLVAAVSDSTALLSRPSPVVKPAS